MFVSELKTVLCQQHPLYYTVALVTYSQRNKFMNCSFYMLSDRYVLVGSRHDSDQGGGASAIMNQLIAALTEQSKRGWVPDRTTVFCSWGGSALGNIGSYEWGKVSKHKSICFIKCQFRGQRLWLYMDHHTHRETYFSASALVIALVGSIMFLGCLSIHPILVYTLREFL